MKTMRFSGSFLWFCLKTKAFCKGARDFYPLDDQQDTLHKNFKITCILEGLSLKLRWMGSVRQKPNEVNLTPQCFTLVRHEIFVARL